MPPPDAGSDDSGDACCSGVVVTIPANMTVLWSEGVVIGPPFPRLYYLDAVREIDERNHVTWTARLPDHAPVVWRGRHTPHWWRTVAMTDEWRTRFVNGKRLTLHPSTCQVLVEEPPYR